MADSDDDSMPQLSAYALAALQEFYMEQEKVVDEPNQMPEEDWQLSQFWYDKDTTTALANEALAVAGHNGRIICISCPTLYNYLRGVKPSSCTALLMEYDRRFEKYGSDFLFYDYKNPTNVPEELHHSFDLVVVDPPFLSEECLKNTSETVKLLTNKKILLCTGATMEELSNEVLNVKPCSFKPKHTRNLANEFRCYTNYQPFTLEKKQQES